jgi:hypothetical protein
MSPDYRRRDGLGMRSQSIASHLLSTLTHLLTLKELLYVTVISFLIRDRVTETLTQY